MKLRPYQQQAKDNVLAAWDAGVKNTLVVLPTGAGKTVLFSDTIKDHKGASCAIAHRQELVTQISMALARDKVAHRIIGPNNVIRTICHQHQTEFGRSFYDPGAPCAVAGVDTLGRRSSQLSSWMQQVTLWVQDEAHHLLTGNKWGKATSLFPNAKGLGVTATPTRADGKGLGSDADGVFEHMYVGPAMRELINTGYLTDYRIFAPPSDLDLEGVKITGQGDYSPNQLRQRVQKSHIVGDVVEHYCRIARGKLGVTFVNSVETAQEVSDAYNVAGIPAEIVTAKTPDDQRVKIIQRFKRRELLQLVNVDLFGEGFDLPAIEVVSMARPTQSYGLYAQQFGRALRLMVDAKYQPYWDSYSDAERLVIIASSSKPTAIIIDHVGNFMRHGRPDTQKAWTLDRKEKRSSKVSDEIPLRNCLNPVCLSVYEGYKLVCPYCGESPTPTARNNPKFVDGDLVELDPDTLMQMEADANKITHAPMIPQGVGQLAIAGIKKQHFIKQKAQGLMRDALQWWAGVHTALGYSDRESQKIFYFKFHIDVLSAQACDAKSADALSAKIWAEISQLVNKYNLTGVPENGTENTSLG